MFDNMFNGIMGKIAPGCCRLSYNGSIAVRTSSGKYKTYNLKTGNLTNCDRFVLDACDDLFMVVPTRKLKAGDIVIFNGKPKCIIEVDGKTVKAVNYDDSTIDTILPERHVLMGKQFYGKIVSIMGTGFGKTKGGFFKNMLKFKMMSAMMGGKSGGMGDMFGSADGSSMLPMMMLMGNGNMDGLFGDMFDGDGDDDSFQLPFGDDDESDEPEAPAEAD